MNPGERHDPMPGVVQLPGFLWRRLPRAVRVVLVVLALAGAAAVVASIPGVRTAKREAGERERREAAATRAQTIRKQRELVRPRRAVSVTSLATLERKIAADVAKRERKPPMRIDCRELRARTPTPFSCVAVTSEVTPSDGSRGVTVGFPYRAVADFRSGRVSFCRALGQPGEGAFRKGFPVTLPAECGG